MFADIVFRRCFGLETQGRVEGCVPGNVAKRTQPKTGKASSPGLGLRCADQGASKSLPLRMRHHIDLCDEHAVSIDSGRQLSGKLSLVAAVDADPLQALGDGSAQDACVRRRRIHQMGIRRACEDGCRAAFDILAGDHFVRPRKANMRGQWERVSSFMALSSPESVRGNMRSSIRRFTIWIDCPYCQCFSAIGFSHTADG